MASAAHGSQHAGVLRRQQGLVLGERRRVVGNLGARAPHDDLAEGQAHLDASAHIED